MLFVVLMKYLFLSSLVSVISVSLDTSVSSCVTTTKCVDQIYNISRESCLLHHVVESRPCVISSSLQIFHHDAIPDSHAWARCKMCFWDNNKFQVIDTSNGSETEQQVEGEDLKKEYDKERSKFVDISWSSWGEFFHYRGHADRIQAEILSLSNYELLSEEINQHLFRNTIVIDRPVFYIPVIAFHYGHILIDVIEQMHGAMIDAYGKVRLDSLLLLDTANQSERQVLQVKLNMFCNGKEINGNFCLLLRWLTSAPILSSSFFLEGRRVLFIDIHVGSDMSHSFFAKGMARQPCHFVATDPYVERISNSYLRFRDHIWKSYLPNEWLSMSNEEKAFSREHPPAIDVLFVQRRNNRVVSNMDEMINLTRSYYNLQSEIIELEDMHFVDQLTYFHNSACVVAAAGTATHNMLFMRPGTCVIVLMQQEWCEYSWMYVNQGILLGLSVHVLCHEPDFGLNPAIKARHSSFVNKFWNQGNSSYNYKLLINC